MRHSDNVTQTPVTVLAAVIVLMALVSSFAVLNITPDFETAGKQLAILWSVALAVMWFIGRRAAGPGVVHIIGTMLAASTVLAMAYFVWWRFGDAGLTWTAIVIGGLFLIGVVWQVLVVILGVSIGTITLLGILIVGGIYHLSSR